MSAIPVLDHIYLNKLNKTFARRVGKTLTTTNKQILSEILPKYRYNKERFSNDHRDKYLEIGFGMGEHAMHQIISKPNALYIGAEVYLNGVANFLKVMRDYANQNYMLWPDDIDLILNEMSPNSLNGVYILFPDPWHKRKYLPRRLFNSDRLLKIKDKLKTGGFISFASDIDDYFLLAKNLIIQDEDFSFESKDFSKPHDGYVQTKYHQKAILEGRNPQFITAIYRNLK